jgi:ParB family chromosome partitioning protein
MLIDIEKVIVKDRIRKDFGDIKELADDIRQNGLINPPVVNRDYELLAGERRLLACKSLGWGQIEVRMMDTRDAEHELNVEISENENRKEFSKSERVDYMKRLLRIEQAKAKERQGTRNDLVEKLPQCPSAKSRDVVAEQFGISGRTMGKELAIVDNKELIPAEDFADWDEGKLSTNKVFQDLKRRLSQTDREIKFYKDRISALENRKPEKVTVEVVPEDYEDTKRKLAEAKRETQRLEADYQKAREKILDQDKTVEDLKAQLGQDKLLKDAGRDIRYFTTATHDYIRRYGGHVWTFEQIHNVDEATRQDFIMAIMTLDGFAQQLIKNIGGELNGSRE